MLIHGVYSPPGAIDSKLEEQKEMKRMEKRMMHLCDKKGVRSPHFHSFIPYSPSALNRGAAFSATSSLPPMTSWERRCAESLNATMQEVSSLARKLQPLI